MQTAVFFGQLQFWNLEPVFKLCKECNVKIVYAIAYSWFSEFSDSVQLTLEKTRVKCKLRHFVNKQRKTETVNSAKVPILNQEVKKLGCGYVL